jgi:hypothetical protein
MAKSATQAGLEAREENASFRKVRVWRLPAYELRLIFLTCILLRLVEGSARCGACVASFTIAFVCLNVTVLHPLSHSTALSALAQTVDKLLASSRENEKELARAKAECQNRAAQLAGEASTAHGSRRTARR